MGQVFTFRIGDVFPATDPVAKFVTGLAMINNDSVRLFNLLEMANQTNDRGLETLTYRLLIGFHHEAIAYIVLSRSRYHAEIEDFLARLPDEARAMLDDLVDGESIAATGAVATRNTVMHYPAPSREAFVAGSEEMAIAVDRVSDLSGDVDLPADPEMTVHAFADAVAASLVPSSETGELDTDAVSLMSTRLMLVWNFVNAVLEQYLDGQPSEDLDGPIPTSNVPPDMA